MVADIEIAQNTPMRPIVDVAADLGLTRDDLVRKGDYIAKVRVAAVDRARKARQGKLVLVTGTTPTRYGEGKTLTTVGLGQALNRIGTKAIIAVREPSLGPVFGTKGGATGGGHSQVLPMEEINLHFTGDIHAVGAANDLIAAVMDAHLFHGNVLDLDPTRVLFPRCLDMTGSPSASETSSSRRRVSAPTWAARSSWTSCADRAASDPTPRSSSSACARSSTTVA